MTEKPRLKAEHGRFETLDGMRGVAAISIMLFHYAKYREPRPLANAPLAVDLFFMLSGFVIAHSYGEKLRNGMSTGAYVIKRFIRLAPAFVCGILLGTAVLYLFGQDGLTSGSLANLPEITAANLFSIPVPNDISVRTMGTADFTVNKTYPGNPPAWSLFFEIVASLAFLALVRLKRVGLVATAAGSLAIFLACGFYYARQYHVVGLNLDCGWGPQNFIGGFPRVLFGFTTGMLLYSVSTETRLAGIRASVRRYVRSSYFLYFGLVLVFLYPGWIHGLYATAILVLVAPALIYAGSVVTCDHVVTLGTARFLGWISYPLYILHFPIGLAVFWIAGRHHLSNTIALGLALLTSVVVAAILTKFYEEPVRALLSKAVDSRIHRPG